MEMSKTDEMTKLVYTLIGEKDKPISKIHNILIYGEGDRSYGGWSKEVRIRGTGTDLVFSASCGNRYEQGYET